MRFLKLGALALSLAALPTQNADAAGYSRLSIGFNFCWEVGGGNRERCVTRYHSSHAHHGHHGHHGHQYIAVMPGQAHPQPAQWQAAPPPVPDRRPGDRKEEETMLQWGYPSLGYSYYHPVSYLPSQQTQTEPAPVYYYYVPQTYTPPAYWYPGGYSTPGVTFDR